MRAPRAEQGQMKIIATNKKAYHDSYAAIKNGEVFLTGAHISPYEKGSYFNVDPLRPRKLLLNKAEIRRLKARTEQKGYTIVPLKVYFKDSLVKVELGLCRGKDLYDKRESIKRREEARKLDRIKKEFNAR